ncbi:MAG: hypothetical protein AAGK17_00770 [Pseudomonadota bacterium]
MSLPDFTHPAIAVFYSIFGAAVALGWVLGGKPERCGALTLASIFSVQLILYSTISDPTFDEIDFVGVITDAIGLLGFTAIALSANRIWPLFAAAMQLIAVLAHLTHGFRPMLGQSYVDFEAYPTAFVTLCVIGGVAMHRYRLKKYGHDRDWVPFKKYQEYRALAQETEQF